MVINTGSEGLDLATFLEVPEINQKVLQYVRESKLAIWEYLQNTKKNNNYIKTFQLSKRQKHNISTFQFKV